MEYLMFAGLVTSIFGCAYAALKAASTEARPRALLWGAKALLAMAALIWLTESLGAIANERVRAASIGELLQKEKTLLEREEVLSLEREGLNAVHGLGHPEKFEGPFCEACKGLIYAHLKETNQVAQDIDRLQDKRKQLGLPID